MWRDFRHAAHALRGNPLFTLAAVLALGLAIGANAAIFGLVDALWFRPPGVRHTGQLVRIFASTDADRSRLWLFPEYRDIRDRTRSFDGVIARGRRGAILPAADGTDQLVLVNVVSMNFFTTLGVLAKYGRLFAPGKESTLDRNPGIVLGHAFWRDRFGGDPSVVGSTVKIGRGASLAVVVLGVLPQTFRDLDAGADRDLWIPTPTWSLLNGREEFERRDERWFDLVARRRAHVSVRAASAEVATLATSMAREVGGTSVGRSARVISELSYRLETGGVNTLTLLGLVLLVVLITCVNVNVANLLLARGAARSRELAVRVAMGATRLAGLGLLLTAVGVYGVMAYRTTRRTREIGIRVALGAAHSQVVRMVLREGISVAVIGIGLGIPVALIVTHLLSSLLFGVSPWDVPSFAMATGVLVLTVAAATLIPAIRASRVDPSVALRDS